MNSWVLNTSKCVYEPPVSRPNYAPDDFWFIDWIESNQRWERKTPTTDSEGNVTFPENMEEYWNPNTSSWVSI